MHQSPAVAHGFNHQSFFQQPVSNLRQINEVLRNQNNEIQQTRGVRPYSFPSIPHQQFISEYATLEQIYSSLNDPNVGTIYAQNALNNNYENNLAKNVPHMPKTDHRSKERMCLLFFCCINIIFFFRV